MSSFRSAALSRMAQKFYLLIDHSPAALDLYQVILQTESLFCQGWFDAKVKHEFECLCNEIKISNLPELAEDEGSKPD